jgi:hypothetical protein
VGGNGPKVRGSKRVGGQRISRVIGSEGQRINGSAGRHRGLEDQSVTWFGGTQNDIGPLGAWRWGLLAVALGGADCVSRVSLSTRARMSAGRENPTPCLRITLCGG